MADQLRFRVPRYDFDISIELLSDLAPTTTAALRDSLPSVGLVTAENRYGSVVCLRLPTFPLPLRSENASVFPVPGDVFVFEREHGAELVVFYERMGGVPAGVPFDGLGPKAGNRVGSVASSLTPVVRGAARRCWSDGAAWGAAGPAETVKSIKDEPASARAEIEVRRQIWRERTWRDHLGPQTGGGRRVALIIPEYNSRTLVDLAVDAAPHTCEEIWSHLPVETTLMHGRYSGPEMFTSVGGQQWHWTPKRENSTAQPISGDLVLYIDPPPRIQINYFHDRDAIPYGTPNPEVGNLVGWSTGDFHGFAESCWRVGYEGWKTLVVERVE